MLRIDLIRRELGGWIGLAMQYRGCPNCPVTYGGLVRKIQGTREKLAKARSKIDC